MSDECVSAREQHEGDVPRTCDVHGMKCLVGSEPSTSSLPPGTAAISQAAPLGGMRGPHYSQPCRCDNFQKPELFVILNGVHSKINCVQRIIFFVS